ANNDNSNDANPKDIMMGLPFDLAVMVVKCLGVRELYTCSLVSRGWRKLFTDPSVIHPILIQVSHFDQEPVLFRHLPNGHGATHDSDSKKEEEEGEEQQRSNSKDGDGAEETPEALRTRLEESTNMQWIKNPKVIMRLLQKTLNREHR
ncbi:hypothetical protein GGI22_007259, partial [Coemansia erecta]